MANTAQPESAQPALRMVGNDLYARALERMERELFARVLAKCSGNQSLACEWLGISRRTLYARLKAYGMLPEKHKSRYFGRRRPLSRPQPSVTSVIELVIGARR